MEKRLKPQEPRAGNARRPVSGRIGTNRRIPLSAIMPGAEDGIPGGFLKERQEKSGLLSGPDMRLFALQDTEQAATVPQRSLNRQCLVQISG